MGSVADVLNDVLCVTFMSIVDFKVVVNLCLLRPSRGNPSARHRQEYMNIAFYFRSQKTKVEAAGRAGETGQS